MPTLSPPNQYGSKELFRYVKLQPIKILDLNLKAAKVPGLKSIVDSTQRDRQRWALQFISSDDVIRKESDLRFDYFSYLKIASLPSKRLPSKKGIKDFVKFDATNFEKEINYKKDYENSLKSLLAFIILEADPDEWELTKIVNFLEIFPNLKSVNEEWPYMPAVLNKTEFKVPKKKEQEKEEQPENKRQELKQVVDSILAIWKASNKLAQAKKNEFEAEYNNLSHVEIEPKKSKHIQGIVDDEERNELKAERSKELTNYLKEQKSKLFLLKEEYEKFQTSDKVAFMLQMEPNKLLPYVPFSTAHEISRMQSEVKSFMEKNKLPVDSFNEAYDQVASMLDTSVDVEKEIVSLDCFTENPVFNAAAADSVRILGSANLIKVEENLIKYSVGEISYVENILAGEIRRREVKNTKYFEQSSEMITEEITDSSKESSIASKQELSNQIDNELNTQLNSDINASANASGGGTIGVVDLSGGANVQAGLGIDVSNSLKTSNKSNFSQEIVSKAVEKFKKTSIQKRLSKSYSQYEVLNYHGIDNSTGTDPQSRNGIYCFLDKHICISEKVYGKRVFLLATTLLPGKNLLCERLNKRNSELKEIGEKPVFDITPDKITTESYKRYVSQFKAANVQPPPSNIISLGRTYKTDNTNATTQQPEFNAKKIADFLVTIFEQYKRFLITDTIKIPEGYQVVEVKATINHGSNGISIPAQLPVALGGAALAGPPLLAGATALGTFSAFTLPLIPLSTLLIGNIISPLLYHNTDSSNVMICVGNNSTSSKYYFFEPDFLLRQVFNLFGSFAMTLPSVLEGVKEDAEHLFDANRPAEESLVKVATEIPKEISTIVNAKVDELIGRINALKSSLGVDWNVDFTPPGALNIWLKGFNDFQTVAVSVGGLEGLMGGFFQPLKNFVEKTMNRITAGLQNAVTEFTSYLIASLRPSETITFDSNGINGFKGELPVSIDALAIKPGVTINLTVTLKRTAEGYDKWKLETFNSLYQSYLQLLAEHESRVFMSEDKNGLAQSPGTMRGQEHIVMKERVLHCLNNYHDEGFGNVYDLERMNLFENAIDWKNMSYRLFNYGPNWKMMKYDRLFAFAGADERRKSFLTALWAQVLVPLQPDENLEKQIGQYFTDGTFSFDGEVNTEKQKDDLTALYQNLILERALIDEQPVVTPIRKDVIPTDLVVIVTPELQSELDQLENKTTPCKNLANGIN